MTVTLKIAPSIEELGDAPTLRPVSVELEITQPDSGSSLEALTQHFEETARAFNRVREVVGLIDPEGLKAFLSLLRPTLQGTGLRIVNKRGRNKLVVRG
uniref:hypothetical protein n=1 Tax=Rhodococcus qingshengii TaxID=334542 RepID=UPI001C4DE6C5|nr:hypothetical protein [Rhodococcus qingshengii]